MKKPLILTNSVLFKVALLNSWRRSRRPQLRDRRCMATRRRRSEPGTLRRIDLRLLMELDGEVAEVDGDGISFFCGDKVGALSSAFGRRSLFSSLFSALLVSSRSGCLLAEFSFPSFNSTLGGSLTRSTSISMDTSNPPRTNGLLLCGFIAVFRFKNSANLSP